MEFRASHILVSDKSLAESLYERVRKGESFSSLASQYSKCPSKSKGGDLGWFKEGAMVREFENQVRRMGVGSISKPVRTQFGYHIIKKTGARGVVLNDGNLVLEKSGGEEITTNNKMELSAVIGALSFLKENGIKSASLYTDSQYVKNGITTWIHSWKKNGWRTSQKGEVKNKEYWIRLDELNRELNLEWNWVKGHAGIKWNERVDELTQLEIAKFR